MKTEMMLPPETRAVAALKSDAVGKELAALVEQSKAITEITNQAGRAECHAAAMRAKSARVGIEKAGKEARDDATAFSKAVIAEVKRLSEIVEPEEERLLAIRDKWDAEREAEKQAKIEAERQRIAEIQKRISDIRAYPLRASGTSAQVEDILKGLRSLVIDDSFKEFFGEAMNAKEDAITHLVILRDTRAAEELEADRVAEERRVAALKSEQERIAREAEINRRAEENERIRSAQAEEQARLDKIRADQAAAAAKIDADIAEFERVKAEFQKAVDAEEAAKTKAKTDAVELEPEPATEEAEPLPQQQEQIPSPVDQQAIVVENQDNVRAFLDSREWKDDQARNTARAIVMEWEKFKAAR